MILILGLLEILAFPFVLYFDIKKERETEMKSKIFKFYSLIVSITALLAVYTN